MKKNSIIYVLGLALATASLAGCKPAGPSLEGIRVKTQPTVTEYAYEYTGDVSLAGLEVEAYYSDETTKALAEDDYTHSSLTPTAAAKLAGKFTVTLTYQEKEAKVEFRFREPDPWSHSWPEAEVAALVKDYAGEDKVPAWNVEGSKFIVEEDYNDIWVVLPGEPTLEEKVEACEAYNEALLSETNGYQESENPLFDYAAVSPHNTIDVQAYVWGEEYGGDDEIYIAVKPHQAKDYLKPVYDRTDSVPTALKADIGLNDYIYAPDPEDEDSDVKLVIIEESADAANQKVEAIINGLYGEDYLPFYKDSYGDMYQASPNEEVVVCAWSSGTYVIVDIYYISDSAKQLTKAATYPSDDFESFLNQGHATVPAIEGASEFYYSNNGITFKAFAKFATAEAAAAYAETFVAALGDGYTLSRGVYTSTDHSVTIELEANGKFVAFEFGNPAAFPLESIRQFYEDDFDEETFPCIAESTGNVYFAYSTSSRSGSFTVNAYYASADAAEAALEEYVAIFTAEESGYEAYVGGGYYNEELGLRFVPSHRTDALYFQLVIYEWNKDIEVDELIAETFEMEEGETFGFPKMIVRSSVEVEYDDETFAELNAVAFMFESAKLADKYGSNYVDSIYELYSSLFGFLDSGVDSETGMQIYIFKYLPAPYITIAFLIYENALIIMFEADEEAFAGWAALSTYLGVDNYETYIPEINGNHFDFITPMNDGSVVLQYTFEGDDEELELELLYWLLEARYNYGFVFDDSGTLHNLFFTVNFGIAPLYDEEENLAAYVITFYISPMPELTAFPSDYFNALYGVDAFPEVESEGITFEAKQYGEYGYIVTATGEAEDILALEESLETAFSNSEYFEYSDWYEDYEYFDYDTYYEYDVYWIETDENTLTIYVLTIDYSDYL